MRLGKYLSSLTKPELELIKNMCNFSEEESIIYDMLAHGKSVTEVSSRMGMSDRTVERRMDGIKNKAVRVVVKIAKDNKEVDDMSKVSLSKETIRMIMDSMTH